MINSPLKKTILEWQKKTRKDRGNPFGKKWNNNLQTDNKKCRNEKKNVMIINHKLISAKMI